MNANLLAVINRIVAEQGEGILTDAKRLFPYFSDYAKNENKEERVAFGRCIEYGAYQALKNTRAVDERRRLKATLTDQVNAKTGVDRPHCSDALDLLETVIFKPAQQPYPPAPVQVNSVFCTNCGSRIPADAVFCTNCGQTVNAPTPQNQYSALPQSPSPFAKKTKRKTPIIIAAAAVVVIVVVVIYYNTRPVTPWEGYVSFEDFAGAAEINDILSIGALNEQGFYALMGGAFAGSILGPFITGFMGAFGIDVTVTAKIDLVSSAKLSEKYKVPHELLQNYNYLVRRTGIRGSKTYLALRFDSKRVFDVSFPYSDWVVMVYEEGAFIKF
jgi:hypothetical protein